MLKKWITSLCLPDHGPDCNGPGIVVRSCEGFERVVFLEVPSGVYFHRAPLTAPKFIIEQVDG